MVKGSSRYKSIQEKQERIIELLIDLEVQKLKVIKDSSISMCDGYLQW